MGEDFKLGLVISFFLLCRKARDRGTKLFYSLLVILFAAGFLMADPTASTAAWPEKGKNVNIIVNYAAGGTIDVAARLIAPYIEKEIGIKVEVLVKPGAGGQIGLTELSRAKPDGHTVMLSSWPAGITTYLSPDAKAIYKHESFQPIAAFAKQPWLLAAKADSPYMTMKDIIEAARKNPASAPVGMSGAVMSTSDIAMKAVMKQSGVNLRLVYFDGDAKAFPAMMGGHVATIFASTGTLVGPVKSGTARVIALTGSDTLSYFPGATTLMSQGFNVNLDSIRGLTGPVGMPKEAIAAYERAVKKATQDPEFVKKMDNQAAPVAFYSSEQYSKAYSEQHIWIKPVFEEIWKQQQTEKK
jgi:tripartite-type tricarboxylate transporter receptor subunit TctC